MDEATKNDSPPPLALSRGVMVFNVITFVGALIAVAALFFGMPRLESSELERRNLATFPTFTASALGSGDYTQEVDLFVADHFPFREGVVEFAFWLRDHRGISVGDEETEPADEVSTEVDDEPAEIVEPPRKDAPNLETQGTVDAAEASDAAQVVARAGTPAAGTRLAGGHLARPPGVSSNGQLKKKEGLLIVDGQAMHAFKGNDEDTTRYAGVINGYAEILGDAVAIYPVIIPSAAAFYLPEKYSRHSWDEPAYIEKTYGQLAPGVRPVKAYESLLAHRDEYLYFRTDHHWTVLGSYYAYRAFAEAAGFAPKDLSQFERRVRDDHYLGTWFGRTRAPELKKSPDRVDYYVPKVSYTAVKYRKSSPDRAAKATFLDEKAQNYGVFLGGDFPLMVATTDVKNDRRVLVVKNSYGNPFVVWLLSHFEKVLVIDYRYFKKDILAVIDEYKVTDLVFINGILTSSTQVHTSLMRRLKKRRRK